jgi:FkbM family methyltransferase
MSLSGVIRAFPPSWIRAVARLQWKHPRLRSAYQQLTKGLKHQDGIIAHGAGKGLRFNPGGANAGFLLGTSEPAVQQVLSELVTPGMVVFDVGANVGFLTLIAARLVGGNGRVIAFEPVPRNAACIARNLSLNRFANVTVRTEALGATDGSAPFLLSTEPTWGRLASLGSIPCDAAGETSVTVRRLDGLLAREEVPPPDLIKIDVEGAELDVLVGAATALRLVRPILMIELHGTNAAIAEQLTTLNYRPAVLGQKGNVAESPWSRT